MSLDLILVDDSSAMRKMIRRVLDVSGFAIGRCHEASNGRDALDVLARERVDVVLTDINMPVMDGEAFVRELRANRELAQLPVIVISTDSTAVRRERLDQLGAQGYLSKPFTPERLRDELERVIDPAVLAGQLGGIDDDDRSF
jgi:two-component system chemotaxis response regulator CheY